jgi:hypothetical protein
MVYLSPPFNGYGVGNNDWGTRWNDAFGNIATVGKTGFVEEGYRDTGVDVQFARHNLDATMQGFIQVGHDWELDTEIRLHIHLLPMANGAGNVYWVYKYFFAPIGTAVPANASWTNSTTTTALVAGDQYDHIARTVFTLTPSGGTPSGILLFEIMRESTHVSDTYSTNKDHGTAQANLGILYVDAHYQKDSPGTATEFA